MPERSRVLFPLTSNSRSLLSGAPAAAVKRRIKVASLMHDDVILEGANVTVYAGPEVNFMIAGAGSRYGENESWQSASERRQSAGKSVTLAPNDPKLRLELPIQSAWRATLEPLKRELPPGLDWLHFLDAGDTHDDGSARVITLPSGQIIEGVPDRLRRTYPKITDEQWMLAFYGLQRDSQLSASLGATLDIPRPNTDLFKHILGSDSGVAINGTDALSVIFPYAGDLDWREIGDLRRDRHVASLRDILREVESIAWQGTVSVADFARLVRDEYGDQLRRAQEALGLSQGGRAVKAVTWLVVGESVSTLIGLPGVGGALGALAAYASDEFRERFGPTHWLLADNRMHRMQLEARR